MAARGRKAATGAGAADPADHAQDDGPSTSTSAATIADLLVTARAADREEVKVNNASAADMKNACDDALKHVRLFSLTLSAPCVSY